MTRLTKNDFATASSQAVLFTPDEDFSSRLVIEKFYPGWSSVFDADPTVLPPIAGAPGEIPRVILHSKSGQWRCEIAPSRMSLTNTTVRDEASSVSLDSFFQQATGVLVSYCDAVKCRVGRVSALAARVAEHSSPARHLSQHFCKDSWTKTALTQPEGFELHALKRFKLAGEFAVNSWARNKTGTLTVGKEKRPIIMFEQDINTLAEDATSASFTMEQIARFMELVVPELDVILSLYYPDSRE